MEIHFVLPVFFYYEKWLGKEEFQCPKCYKVVKSTGFENKSVSPKTMFVHNSKEKESDIKFEIYIKPDVGGKYAIKVTKLMTIRQLKEKIEKKIGYNKNHFILAFETFFNDESKTLEYYGVTKTITLSQYTLK